MGHRNLVCALALWRVTRKPDKWQFLVIILFTGDLGAEIHVSQPTSLEQVYATKTKQSQARRKASMPSVNWKRSPRGPLSSIDLAGMGEGEYSFSCIWTEMWRTSLFIHLHGLGTTGRAMPPSMRLWTLKLNRASVPTLPSSVTLDKLPQSF